MITDADSPRLESIARRIATRQFATVGPPWAGKPQHAIELEIHVIPPLPTETAAKLAELIHAHNPHCIVGLAEQMPASINCLTVFVHTIDSLEADIFTSQVRRGLVDSYYHHCREMFYPHGLQALEQLNIEINGQLRFISKTTKGSEYE